MSAGASHRASTPPGRVRVLAVDDAPTFRGAIRTLVAASGGFELVGEADSGERAIVLAKDFRPDLVLMDVRMPGMGGPAATRAIKALRPTTVVVLISTAHPSELSAEASTCSANEIVWKSRLRPEVLDELWLRHGPGVER